MTGKGRPPSRPGPRLRLAAATLAAALGLGADRPTPGPTATATASPAEASPAPAAPASPAPGAPPRVRPGAEHQKLHFLVGEWAVTAAWYDGESTTAAATAEGRLSVRWDLGGLLLVERWSLSSRPVEYDARRIWSFDPETRAFRVLLFDSAGLAGGDLRAKVAAGRLEVEGQLGTGPAATRERLTYTAAPPPSGDEVVSVAVVEERGPQGGQLSRVFTAELRRERR